MSRSHAGRPATFTVAPEPLVDRADVHAELLGYLAGAQPLFHDPLYHQHSTMERGSGILMMVVQVDLRVRVWLTANHQSPTLEPCGQPL